MSESNQDALVVRLVGKSLYRPEDTDVDGRMIYDMDWIEPRKERQVARYCERCIGLRVPQN